MNKQTSNCDTCPFRGYSTEICKLHSKHAHDSLECDDNDCSWTSWGKKAAIGAGVGITGVFAGMAVLPAFGMKAILGHFLALKVTGAGGVVGAGANVAVNLKKAPTRQHKKKRTILLPRNLGGK